jgi:hypothetical protein
MFVLFFYLFATADTALGCSSAFESPVHRGHLELWLPSKAVSAVARMLFG